MTIPFNRNRISLKERLHEAAKTNIDELGNPNQTFSPEACQRDLKDIAVYIDKSRTYLERVRSKCYAMIDSQLADTTCAIVDDSLDKYRGILFESPSKFLKKAYTVQTFHQNESENINRYQQYIYVGKQFAFYCEKPEVQLTPEQKLLNDVGTVTAAINNLISQMNRIESAIKSITKDTDNDDYTRIFGLIDQIPIAIQVLTDEVVADKPNILNSKGGFLTNLYDDLLAMLERFVAFCSKWIRPNNEPVISGDVGSHEEIEMTTPTIGKGS